MQDSVGWEAGSHMQLAAIACGALNICSVFAVPLHKHAHGASHSMHQLANQQAVLHAHACLTLCHPKAALPTTAASPTPIVFA
jgi:hypothetical protein